MDSSYNTFIPEGFSTVNSYLFVSNAEKQIQFLKDAFKTTELSRTMRRDEIANCILRIGHSCIMISQARGPFEGMRSSFNLFVDNVDAMHQKALDHGASEVFSATDMDYGDRQSGIDETEDNYWWISKRLVEENYQS